jgi:hypothetical protein
VTYWAESSLAQKVEMDEAQSEWHAGCRELSTGVLRDGFLRPQVYRGVGSSDHTCRGQGVSRHPREGLDTYRNGAVGVFVWTSGIMPSRVPQ